MGPKGLTHGSLMVEFRGIYAAPPEIGLASATTPWPDVNNKWTLVAPARLKAENRGPEYLNVILDSN